MIHEYTRIKIELAEKGYSHISLEGEQVFLCTEESGIRGIFYIDAFGGVSLRILRHLTWVQSKKVVQFSLSEEGGKIKVSLLLPKISTYTSFKEILKLAEAEVHWIKSVILSPQSALFTAV